MSKIWRKFVMWLAAKEFEAQAEFYRAVARDYETSWRRTAEILASERDAYKQRYEYILNLQVEATLLQPRKPIIIPASEVDAGRKK